MTLLVLVLVVFSASLSGTPVAAEQPTPVISAMRTDGLFLHNRRDNDLDREALAKVVTDADALGYKMGIVVPIEPLPDLRSFVLRVQQGGEFDIVMGFGNEGEIEAETSEELSDELLSSLRAVRDTDGTIEELSAMFLTELTTEPEATIPPFVWRVIRWVAILLGALVLAGIVEQIWRSQSKRGRRNQPAS